MALIETEGLVLRSYNLQDADKIVVLLTMDEGLIRGVAKGAKRLKSKFGGTLESFSIVNLSYLQKDDRELVSINNIDLIRSFFKDTSQIEFLKKFEYLSELLIDFAPPHDPNKRLYNMTKICLETASEKPNNLVSIVLYFEIWILRLGGFLPSWNECRQCKRIFDDDESANLQFDFHLVCNSCQKHKKNLTITPIQRKLFTIPQKVSPSTFVDLKISKKKEVQEVSQILRRVIAQVLGKEKVGEKILTASVKH